MKWEAERMGQQRGKSPGKEEGSLANGEGTCQGVADSAERMSAPISKHLREGVRLRGRECRCGDTNPLAEIAAATWVSYWAVPTLPASACATFCIVSGNKLIMVVQ